MNRGTFIRRHLLKLMAAAGTIGLPAMRTFSPASRTPGAHPRIIPPPALILRSAKSSFGATAPAAC